MKYFESYDCTNTYTQLSTDNETHDYTDTLLMKADDLIKLMFNGKPAQHEPTKKKDSKDHPLGQLSEQMKQFWASIRELEGPLTEALQAFSDRLSVFNTEVRQLGDGMGPQVLEEHNTVIRGLLDKVIELAKPYTILHSFFFSDLIHGEYSAAAQEQGKCVIGIREGFEVVCRELDNRGDTDSVIDPYKDELARFSGCNCGQTKAHHIAILVPVRPKADGVEAPPDAGPPAA